MMTGSKAEECYTSVFINNKKWAQIAMVCGSMLLALKMVASNLKYDSLRRSSSLEIVTSLCAIHDDPDFRFMGDPAKNCEWVGGNPNVRCIKAGGSCPETCDPDCGSSNGIIKEISNGISEGNNSTIVKERSKGKNSSITCVDDPSFQLNHNPEKNCTWVGDNAYKRCGKEGVLEACPIICNHPDCPCSDDPTFRWDDHPAMNCDWVGENVAVRCAVKVAANACPKACDPECAGTAP